MKTYIIAAIGAVAALLQGQAFGNQWAGRSEYFEVRCAEPNYGFSVDIRNASLQGGQPDNSLFIFLNGSYRGLADVSRLSNVFGKGDVNYLYVDENAWDHCRTSIDKNSLWCHLDRSNSQPITLRGSRSFDGPDESIMQISKMTVSYLLDRDTHVGTFVLNITEHGTGINKRVEYNVPCK